MLLLVLSLVSPAGVVDLASGVDLRETAGEEEEEEEEVDKEGEGGLKLLEVLRRNFSTMWTS